MISSRWGRFHLTITIDLKISNLQSFHIQHVDKNIGFLFGNKPAVQADIHIIDRDVVEQTKAL